MKSKASVLSVLSAFVLLAVLAAPPVEAQSACVKFGPPPALGTTYGAPVAQPPGAVALIENGIIVRVFNFQSMAGPLVFNRAYIDNAPFPFGSGQSIRTNNINLHFDFTALGFRVSRVRLAFLDLGGYENFAVNGSPIKVGELTALPPAIAGVGIAVSSSPLPPPLSGKTGSITLTGPVQTLLIGGQELWIDEVCAS